jgi:hypothetical protein
MEKEEEKNNRNFVRSRRRSNVKGRSVSSAHYNSVGYCPK